MEHVTPVAFLDVSPDLRSASWPRRIAALLIDWVASWLVVLALVGSHAQGWWPLLVFFVESSLGVALAGASFGQLLTRIRVLRTDGHQVDLLRAIARQALICVVIPPVVFKPDGRGLHDLATDSGAYDLPLGAARS